MSLRFRQGLINRAPLPQQVGQGEGPKLERSRDPVQALQLRQQILQMLALLFNAQANPVVAIVGGQTLLQQLGQRAQGG
jgi:hypothetical protein